jgi:hypothetical protein
MTSSLRPWYGAVLGMLLVAGCKENPTASLGGKPAFISIVPNPGFLDEGGATGNVTVRVLDQSSTPLPGSVTATATAPTVASVAPATGVAPDPTNTTSIFTVTSGVPGPAYIRFSGQGLTDSMRVNVLPLVFAGALSKTTPKSGDTLTIKATSVLKFDPATAAVIFPSRDTATVVVANAESLRVLVPVSKAGTLSLNGITLTYVTGITFSGLPTSASVTQTGDLWVADSSWLTAPDITGMLPASGKSAHMIVALTAAKDSTICPEVALAFGSSGPCMIFKFTLAAPTALNFTTLWVSGDTPPAGNPDIDIYACSDSTKANFGTACFEDGGAGATFVDPQSTGNHTYPAGTHYFVIERFATCDNTPSKCTTPGDTKNFFTTISRP